MNPGKCSIQGVMVFNFHTNGTNSTNSTNSTDTLTKAVSKLSVGTILIGRFYANFTSILNGVFRDFDKK